jgi:hypothetical protein
VDWGTDYLQIFYPNELLTSAGGRRNDDFSDEYSTSRPSEGTLWDFLETKLPSKGNFETSFLFFIFILILF